jgi:hypothetical protein
MTQRGTKSDQLDMLYYGEELRDMRVEKDVMVQLEQLVTRYGYGDNNSAAMASTKIDSMAVAYGWIEKLSKEMHLDSRHERVNTVREARESIEEMAAQIG